MEEKDQEDSRRSRGESPEDSRKSEPGGSYRGSRQSGRSVVSQESRPADLDSVHSMLLTL